MDIPCRILYRIPSNQTFLNLCKREESSDFKCPVWQIYAFMSDRGEEGQFPSELAAVVF